MTLLRKLTIALYRLFFGVPARSRPASGRSHPSGRQATRAISRTRSAPPQMSSKSYFKNGSQSDRRREHYELPQTNAYRSVVQDGDDWSSQEGWDSQAGWNTPIEASLSPYTIVQPYWGQPAYSPYPQPGYSSLSQWQGIDDEYEDGYGDEYEDEYENEYEEDELDEEYGIVEYRFETFGGDTFIEFSYEGDLDEQEIVRVLNSLWSSTADRTHNLLTNQVLAGTLRMPVLPSRPVYYLPQP